ncbi:hypothetical protein F3Y22_tig00111022pilonHSYRG00164 [Hibiscus syriacus]|uniref:Reverse transcriptase domain-containing protein n=1 Tax=Hibiscus syriacus TaxID=106335 RepID=A0A6A2Z7Q3_HIBSY|nr:hypothetical protein F3Y22_tig00111022pilonHSYRG00164 [Hibiscus syriacus]
MKNQSESNCFEPSKFPSQTSIPNSSPVIDPQVKEAGIDHNCTIHKDLHSVPIVEKQHFSSDPPAIVEYGSSSLKSSPKHGRERPPNFWNIRGFDNPLKQNKVLLRASQNNVDILCLSETRVKAEKSNVNFDSLLVNWYVSTNYDFAINGRIWILWKKNIELSIFQVSDQIISAKGKYNGNPFVISAVYGSNDTISRRQLWQNLHELERNIGHLPWILGGDFNITLYPNEISDYELLSPYSSPEIEEFQDVTHALDLHDHPFFSPLFTWSNKQSGSYLARKLDRVFINPNWVNTFQSSFVEFLSPGVSNHCDDVVAAVKYFFQHSTMLPTFNSTTIALIPKVPNPSKVKDFRPISCCSVIYKSITKILVKRLTSLIPGIISLNQTALIKGMSIVDNTLLAQELVRGYGRKIISPRCSLMIDLQKAFDTLHWDFIYTVLKALNLPQRFINCTEACFTKARFSISFNGSLIGCFKGTRGIRQGDPLSPILFVISMNVLSSLLNFVVAKELFSYHPKCKRI